MNIENLKEGQTIKNYKELCSLVEERIKSGASKKSQLKEFERFVKYHKEGNKFVIEEIYEEPLEKIDNRGGVSPEYIKDIEIGILNELIKYGDRGYCILGATSMYKSLGMININYSYCKRRQNKLAKFLSVDNDLIKDYYSSVDSMILNNLNKALSNLIDEALIETTSKILINKNESDVQYEHSFVIDEFQEEVEVIDTVADRRTYFIEATEEEEKIITNARYTVLNEMGFKKLSSVFGSPRVNEFFNNVNIEVRKHIPEYNYSFKAYRITYTYDNIIDKLDRIGYDYHSKMEKENLDFNVNNSVQKRIIENASNRKTRIEKEYENCMGVKREEKHKCRLDDNYIYDYVTINSKIINIDSMDIREKVKKSINTIPKK